MTSRLLGLGLLAMAFSASVAIAQGFPGHHGPDAGFGDPERFVQHIISRLDLDETRAQEVRNIFEAAKPQFDDLRDRAMRNHDAVRALDVKDPDYDAKLSDLARQNGELASEATLLHGKLRAQLSETLTAEQLQKLEDERPEHFKRWHHGENKSQ